MKIRLAAYLQSDSIVDGEGIRTVIWTQGCPHHCHGCHNPKTWNTKGGALIDIEDVLEEIDKLEGQAGVTFSGGDPFMQPKECAIIAKHAKSRGLNVWCYTGYTFDELLILSKKDKKYLDFLESIDVLIDGKFELESKTLSKVFAGSSNQRIIDVKSSLEKEEVILVSKYITKEEDSINKIGIYI